jgi:hypothetical protein
VGASVSHATEERKKYDFDNPSYDPSHPKCIDEIYTELQKHIKIVPE